MKIKRKDLNKLIENLLLELNPDIVSGVDPNVSNTQLEQIKDHKTQLIESLDISEAAFDEIINSDDCYLEFVSTNPMTEGKMYWKNSSGTILCQWDAVSGKEKYFNENPKETMKIKNEGPTPEGIYEVGEVQSADKSLSATAKGIASFFLGRAIYNWNLNTIARQVSWGNFRMPLIPHKDTNTFGRTSMYIHGGLIPGSIGCIDLLEGIDSFAQLYNIWHEKHGRINIKVIYN